MSVPASATSSPVSGLMRSPARKRAATESLASPLSAFQVEWQVDVARRAAVLVVHDDILGDVDEAAGQVARVGGTQGRVGLALPRAVGRGEVLQHREALHEVTLHGLLDDLTLRVRHQAAHAGELGEVVVVTTGAGVGHHVDRVQAPEVVLHGLLDLVLGLGPERYYALQPLVVGDEALVPLVLDLVDHGPGSARGSPLSARARRCRSCRPRCRPWWPCGTRPSSGYRGAGSPAPSDSGPRTRPRGP